MEERQPRSGRQGRPPEPKQPPSSTPQTPLLSGRSAMADALGPRSRTPIRRDSFDRPNGIFPTLDTTPRPTLDTQPRRFSTGAAVIPMPTAQVRLAQTEAQLDLEEKWEQQQSRELTPTGNGGGDGKVGKEMRDLGEAMKFELFSGIPTSMRLQALAAATPCHFHSRFGDAVDIDKVLEEVQGDEQLNHSRLMQTAAMVREVGKKLQRKPLKRAARNVMVITKARDNNLVTLTRELTEWLLETPRYGKDVGVNVYVDQKLKGSKRFDVEGLYARNKKFKEMLRFWTPALCLEKPEQFDLVVTLGGDGTVLYTSWLFQRVVPPVLAFSLGSLGFLTNFDFENYKEQLNHIMGDAGMRVNMRMRFTCTVYRSAATSSAYASTGASSASISTTASATNTPPNNPSTSTSATTQQHPKIEGETHEVLNELVIDRGPSSYISSLDLHANDSLLTRISADGIILSTPTGSTAYSLSAGGSLVHPDIPAILLTPICPHTLSFRPMLLNDDMALKVAIPSTGRGGAFVSFDGKGRVELGRGDEVVVRASQYPFPTVMGQPLEWFDSISRTLRWNTRAAEQKGWSGGEVPGRGRGGEFEGEVGGDVVEGEETEREVEFDIDFDEEEGGPEAGEKEGNGDSGYGGASADGEVVLGRRWR